MKADELAGDLVEETAREWVVYLHSGSVDPSRQEEFLAWLAADPAHQAAYRHYAQLMGDLTLVDALDHVPSVSNDFPARRSWALAVPAQLAAALVLAASLAFLGLWVAQTVEEGELVVETVTAEIRDVPLEDGSIVTLGARSEIEARFAGQVRHVMLIEGEAYFDIASDPNRPFFVTAGDRVIKVVGTEFSVRHTSHLIRVTVAEGVVEVFRATEGTELSNLGVRSDLLLAGDQITVAGKGQEIRKRVEPKTSGAWRRGWLTYENASLAEIVADANRYDEREIVLASPELAEIRMTAAFGVDTIDQFISALSASHPIEVDQSRADRIVLRTN